jgi:hypothetical protein
MLVEAIYSIILDDFSDLIVEVREVMVFLGSSNFFLEFGLTLMSGKKDSEDFKKESFDFSIFYCSLTLSKSCLTYTLGLSFDKSKPPPVCIYFLALLYSYCFNLDYSCSFICFLRAYSALL